MRLASPGHRPFLQSTSVEPVRPGKRPRLRRRQFIVKSVDMTSATATFPSVILCDRRVFAFGNFARVIVHGVISATAATAVTCATLALVLAAAGWIVGLAISANPHLHASALIESQRFAPSDRFAGVWRARVAGALRPVAIANPRRPVRRDPSRATMVARWNPFAPQTVAPGRFVPFARRHLAATTPGQARHRPAQVAELGIDTPPRPAVAAASPKHMADQEARLLTLAPRIRLPLPRPADAPRLASKPEAARSAEVKAAPLVTASIAAPPASITGRRRPPSQDGDAAIPRLESDKRTAIYDIEAHTVYLPNGKRLEAHSGLGHRLDDPRYVKARNLRADAAKRLPADLARGAVPRRPCHTPHPGR